jgi:hypothetical protein
MILSRRKRIWSYGLEFKRKEHLKKGVGMTVKCNDEVKSDES